MHPSSNASKQTRVGLFQFEMPYQNLIWYSVSSVYEFAYLFYTFKKLAERFITFILLVKYNFQTTYWWDEQVVW